MRDWLAYITAIGTIAIVIGILAWQHAKHREWDPFPPPKFGDPIVLTNINDVIVPHSLENDSHPCYRKLLGEVVHKFGPWSMPTAIAGTYGPCIAQWRLCTNCGEPFGRHRYTGRMK